MAAKKWTSRGPSQHLEHIAQQLTEGKRVGEGVTKWVPMRLIRTNPLQPRRELQRLGITQETVSLHLEGKIDLLDPSNTERSIKFEELLGLAASIKSQSLINPITLCLDQEVVIEEGGDEDMSDYDEHYIVDTGERRFLAHLINGAKEIRANIKQLDPNSKDSRARQLVENINREDLTAADKIASLRDLNRMHVNEMGVPLEAKDLIEMLGISRRLAGRYISILSAPSDVHAEIESGAIGSLHQAEEMARLKTEGERANYLKAIKAGSQAEEKRVVESAQPSQSSKKEEGVVLRKTSVASSAPGPGERKARAVVVKLGKTKNIGAVQVLISKHLGKAQYTANYGAVDWSDHEQANEAWGRFWATIETEVK